MRVFIEKASDWNLREPREWASLDDLKKFIEENGAVIIGRDIEDREAFGVTIYDDYVE